MKYDFTTVYDRRGMDALAVDALGQPGGFAPGKPKDGFSVIPMWVADAKRWRTCCTPAGMWAWPGRTAGCSTTPAPSA